MDGQLSNKRVRGWISRRQIKGGTMEAVYEIQTDGRYIHRRSLQFVAQAQEITISFSTYTQVTFLFLQYLRVMYTKGKHILLLCGNVRFSTSLDQEFLRVRKELLISKVALTYDHCAKNKANANGQIYRIAQKIHCQIVVNCWNDVADMRRRATGLEPGIENYTIARGVSEADTKVVTGIHGMVIKCGYMISSHMVLKACLFLGFIRLGKEIHCAMKRGIIATDIYSETTLLNLYSIESKNLATYNSMISAYGEQGLLDECLSLFHEMKGMRLKPDGVTFLAILQGCSHGKQVDEGRYYFKEMKVRYRISPSALHYGCYVGIFTRPGLFICTTLEAFNLAEKWLEYPPHNSKITPMNR
ncbi:unnamed protein product [Lactuca saligna]|uniref:Pentatricopeptide repeat-containing protein n=1 Tax=Lactuca saligna TaxID=75948 RepID=A0AA36EFT9_LACSI|nr:unnamed protein product [Lactuca saligna]